jgi:putative intracellular protease/amidase
MARILVIIPPERFRDEEFFIPLDFLRRQKHALTVASTVIGECPGSRGGKAKAEVLLSAVVADDFDGALFVGGGGSKLLFRDPDALRFAQAMAAHNKPIGLSAWPLLRFASLWPAF